MKITNEQLKSIYYGAYRFVEEDGYLQSFQYTEAQTKYFEEVSEFWYDRCKAGSAKTAADMGRKFPSEHQNTHIFSPVVAG